MPAMTIFEERDLLASRAPFRIDDKVPTDLHEVKINVTYTDGSRGKETLPSPDEDTAEIFMFCFMQFKNKMTELGWQGAKRFEMYRATLRGSVLEDWDDIVEGRADSTLNTFETSIRSLLKTILGRHTFRRQTEYLLRGAKKPKTMTPRGLHRRLRTICNYTKYLLTENGQPPAPFTELEKKRFYIHMCPNEWVEQYSKIDKDWVEEDLDSIVEYMEKLHALEIAKGKQPRKRDDDNGGEGKGKGNGNYHQKSKYQRGEQGRGNPGRGRGGRGRGNDGRGRGDRAKPHPDSLCAYPGHEGLNHKWKDCVFNPDSERFKAKYSVNPGGRGNGPGRAPIHPTNARSGRGFQGRGHQAFHAAEMQQNHRHGPAKDHSIGSPPGSEGGSRSTNPHESYFSFQMDEVSPKEDSFHGDY